MDLPPDKAKVLKNYDDEKKWDLICDQVSLNLLIQWCSQTAEKGYAHQREATGSSSDSLQLHLFS